jgi:hypothetical protein
MKLLVISIPSCPQTYHKKKKLHRVMEELKDVADWLTTGITYTQNQESERKSELQTDYMLLNTMYKTLTGILILTRRLSTHLEG